MPNYRRWFIPGGTYFFTANLVRRDSRLLVEHIDALRAAYADAAKRQPFQTIAICVLPNHLHCIWTLPECDGDFSERWRRIKTGFTRRLPRAADLTPGRRPGERGIWQRRFWEHGITDTDDLAEQSPTSTAIRSSTGWWRIWTIGPSRRGIGGNARMRPRAHPERCISAMPQCTLPIAFRNPRRVH